MDDRRVRAVLFFAGCVLTAGGGLLGITGVVVAGTLRFTYPAPRPKGGAPLEVPGVADLGYATLAAVATALVVLGAVAVAARATTGRRGDAPRRESTFENAHLCVALATAGFIAAVWWLSPIDAFLTGRNERPAEFGYPSALLTICLVAAGSVLVAVMMSIMRDERIPRSAAVRASGSAAALFAAATALSVWLADDSDAVVHTTAGVTATPPGPYSPGTEVYRITVPMGSSTEEVLPLQQGQDNLVAAGAGFVLAGEYSIAAYDSATGDEIWRYERRSPSDGGTHIEYRPDSLRAYDDGSVVLAAWHGAWDTPTTIAFDAFTGEILWSDAGDSGFDADIAVPGPDDTPRAAQPYTYSDGTLTRFDARTGEQLWTTTPARCGVPVGARNLAGPVATVAAVFVVDTCPGPDGTAQVLAVDPADGEIIAVRDFTVAGGGPEHPMTDPPKLTYTHHAADRITLSSDSGSTASVIEFFSPDELLTAPLVPYDTWYRGRVKPPPEGVTVGDHTYSVSDDSPNSTSLYVRGESGNRHVDVFDGCRTPRLETVTGAVVAVCEVFSTEDSIGRTLVAGLVADR